MKKYMLLLLAFVCVVALSACGGEGGGVFGDNETVAGEELVQIDDGAISIDMDADSAKVILGVYSAKELGITKDIYEYDLVLSGTKFEGATGVKIEAYDPEGKKDDPAVGVFMICDGKNYRFDAKQNKYVLIGGAQSATPQTTKAATPVTDENGQVVVTEAIPDDPSVKFQYHKGNNAALQERFAKYDLSEVHLANRLTDYVFVVTDRTGVTADNTTVNVVLLYTKTGEDTGIQFGISENTDYYYKKDAFSYIALTEGSTETTAASAETTAAAQ